MLEPVITPVVYLDLFQWTGGVAGKAPPIRPHFPGVLSFLCLITPVVEGGRSFQKSSIATYPEHRLEGGCGLTFVAFHPARLLPHNGYWTRRFCAFGQVYLSWKSMFSILLTKSWVP